MLLIKLSYYSFIKGSLRTNILKTFVDIIQTRLLYWSYNGNEQSCRTPPNNLIYDRGNVMRKFQYCLADVFTPRAFGGNQLAVFPDARGLSTDEMQALAKE